MSSSRERVLIPRASVQSTIVSVDSSSSPFKSLQKRIPRNYQRPSKSKKDKLSGGDRLRERCELLHNRSFHRAESSFREAPSLRESTGGKNTPDAK